MKILHKTSKNRSNQPQILTKIGSWVEFLSCKFSSKSEFSQADSGRFSVFHDFLRTPNCFFYFYLFFLILGFFGPWHYYKKMENKIWRKFDKFSSNSDFSQAVLSRFEIFGVPPAYEKNRATKAYEKNFLVS